MQAGDLVFFRNTYGSYSHGIITHVGIAVSNADMVDRSTSAHPVLRRSIDGTFPDLFVEARRPKLFVEAPTPVKPGEAVTLLSAAFVVRTADGRLLKLFHNANGTRLV